MSNVPPPPPPGEGPPPGGDAPWWAQAGSGATPNWWNEPGPGPQPGAYPGQPEHMPFTPAPDPRYAQTYWRGPPQARAKGAVAALVWGIISLACCGPITGAVAIYQGSQARYRIRTSNGRLGGNGMALAGMVLGTIALIYWVIGLILILTGHYHVTVISQNPNGS